MEKVDIKKKIHLALVALIFYIQKGTAFSTFPSALTSCASSTANIYFNFSIDANETIAGKRIWFFGADKIAESNETTLTPVPSYSSRLTAYGTSGISLSNITVADAGTYAYVVVLRPTLNPFTAITALSVQEAPLAPPSGCQVSSLNQPGNIPTCAVNTNSGNCGTPSLIAFLVNSTNTSSQFICNVGEIYQCCATSAALTCYSGSSNDFCKLFTCTDVTTTTTTATTVSTTNTEMRTTSIYTTTRSTEIGTTQSTEITTLCPLPVVVIVAITFSGILSILLIIIICCCCCPCCCLYHCRMEQNTDIYGKEFVETNGKGDAKNRTKNKVETQNPAYAMSNVQSTSSTYDTKEVQPTQSFNPTVNETCASDPVWEDKSVPNKNDIRESVQF